MSLSFLHCRRPSGLAWFLAVCLFCAWSGSYGSSTDEPTLGSGCERAAGGCDLEPQVTQRLEALGYFESAYDPNHERRGVLSHEPDAAYPGLNLYASRTASHAQLIDMDGRTVHEWRFGDELWQHIELLPQTGEALVLVKDRSLFKLDAESKLLWRYAARVHHDLSITNDGRIHVLSWKRELVPEIHETVPVRVDYVTTLSPKGELLEEISILDLLRSSATTALLPDRRGTDFGTASEIDAFHTNHVEVFDGSHPCGDPLFRAGKALLSVRELDLVFVADLETRTVDWTWGPSRILRQHQPTLLPSCNLLIFDNGGQGGSAVIEVDPHTGEVVWRYAPGKQFRSALRGSNQRLPNGNTLITESDKGYVFEVTPDGRKVWEFANPDVDEHGKRSVIWRMWRFPPQQVRFLDSSASDAQASSRL